MHEISKAEVIVGSIVSVSIMFVLVGLLVATYDYERNCYPWKFNPTNVVTFPFELYGEVVRSSSCFIAQPLNWNGE